jgi:cell shape-determining protein MreC
VSTQALSDKLAHAKREIKALNAKLEEQADRIKRLTEMNARAQYDRREVCRISDQAFKILGQIRSE